MAAATAIVFLVYVFFGSLSQRSSALAEVRMATGNGILSCAPGVEFPRDCGNRCVCNDDGTEATCTDIECPEEMSEFDAAHNKAYKEARLIKNSLRTILFHCEPRTARKVNTHGAYCYCATSGTAEICSPRKGSPWERH